MEEVSLSSPPAVIALRESFGDRKPPDITRKITACVACRKQKVVSLVLWSFCIRLMNNKGKMSHARWTSTMLKVQEARSTLRC
jgi:hypothetical protein